MLHELGLQWLADHFRPEQKASVFTIKPAFIGKAGVQGRVVSGLCPGLAACI